MIETIMPLPINLINHYGSEENFDQLPNFTAIQLNRDAILSGTLKPANVLNATEKQVNATGIYIISSYERDFEDPSITSRRCITVIHISSDHQYSISTPIFDIVPEGFSSTIQLFPTAEAHALEFLNSFV